MCRRLQRAHTGAGDLSVSPAQYLTVAAEFVCLAYKEAVVALPLVLNLSGWSLQHRLCYLHAAYWLKSVVLVCCMHHCVQSIDELNQLR